MNRTTIAPRSSMSRQAAVTWLVEVLKKNPSRDVWGVVHDFVLRQRSTSSTPVAEAIEEANAVARAARRRARKQMTARELARNEIARQTVASPKHQAAINSLMDLALYAFCPGGFDEELMSAPFRKIPGILRAAVDDASKRKHHPFASEVDLIALVLRLIERNGGDARVRTPETKAFHSACLADLDADFNIRIRHEEESTAVN